MRDLARFLILVGLILISLFAVWIGLRSYGLSQPPSSYQTELVERLHRKLSEEPIVWKPGDDTYSMVFARFEEGSWKSQGMNLNKKMESSSSEFHLLYLGATEPGALPALRAMIKKNKLKNSTIFCGRFDGVLKDLRELEPQWTFCNGEVFLTRFMGMDSLGLSSLLRISADVFFIHMAHLKPTPNLASLITEARRQGKLVFLGPVSRPSEGLRPHGWVVE